MSSITPGAIRSQGGDVVTIRGANFAPGTIVIVAGTLIRDAEIQDTQTIVFRAPVLPSGIVTMTIQNRGGLTQQSLMVEAPSLAGLPAGSVTTFAGGTTFVGDGGAATAATIASPVGVAVDSFGNVFVSDEQNSRIRKIGATTGVITSYAGTGIDGYSGDNGPAVAAQLDHPAGIATDVSGNLYIADTANYRIRRVDAATGIITTVAGAGSTGNTGDGGPATAARFIALRDVAVDAAGNLFMTDAGASRIRRVDRASGVITTIAGRGVGGFDGDGGPATRAAFSVPSGLAVSDDGEVFVADTNNQRIRKVDRSGVITTVVGSGIRGVSADGTAALSAALGDPADVAVDANGTPFFLDSGSGRVRRIDATGLVRTVATGAYPYALAADAAGNMLYAERFGFRVRRVDVRNGRQTTVAGTGERIPSGDGLPATAVQLLQPAGLAIDPGNNVLFADYLDHRIRSVDSRSNRISTVAGNGTQGSVIDPCCKGENGPATAARLSYPTGVTVDRAGHLLFIDYHMVRRVDAVTGILTTLAGVVIVTPGFAGDGGPATAARMNFPQDLFLDTKGNMMIADTGNNRIRRIDAASGVISTTAGSSFGFSGDGGPATAAQFSGPSAISADDAGNVYVADRNHRIRKIDAVTQVVTTFAGTGVAGFSGDGGPATRAQLNNPRGMTFDRAGNLYFADSLNNRIRRIDRISGTITTVAGRGSPGLQGDAGPASAALFDTPTALAFDAAGNLFVSDTGNRRIRAIRSLAP